MKGAERPARTNPSLCSFKIIVPAIILVGLRGGWIKLLREFLHRLAQTWPKVRELAAVHHDHLLLLPGRGLVYAGNFQHALNSSQAPYPDANIRRKSGSPMHQSLTRGLYSLPLPLQLVWHLQMEDGKRWHTRHYQTTMYRD